MKETHIQIRISETQKEKLKEKSEQNGMDMSEAIRFLIQKWVEDK